jgi:hypothetical protein
LASLPLGVAVLVFAYCFTANNPGQTWIVGTVALAISLALVGLSRWYLNRRKYFCICEHGCAYGSSLDAIPKIFPWTEVQEILMEEDAYLKVEEHAVWGVTMSKTMEEAMRQWMHIKSGHDAVRFKLSEFPNQQLIVEEMLECTKDREIHLDHARVESPELVQAKATQADELVLGKKKYYVGGVILFIIFMIIKVAVNMNRR